MEKLVALCQAPRLHLPVVGDLRRHQRRLGLRAARRRAQAQRQGRLVAARWCATATDVVGLDCVDPHAPDGVEGVRARVELRRPDGRLQEVQEALSRRRDRARVRDHGKVPTQCPDPKCKGELTAARKFNLMFETHARPGRRQRRRRRYLRPETAQGIFANFKNVARLDAHQGAVRHRADRQVVPQRDQPAQLHLPLARVRADGDRVLLQARQRRQVVRVLGRAAQEVVPRRSASSRTSCASASTRRRSSRTTRRPPPTWSTCSRSAGASSRASPTAPTTICAQHQIGMRSVGKWKGEELQDFQLVDEDPEWRSQGQAQLLRRRGEAALHPVRDRAVGRRRPRDAGVPVRRVRRGRGGRRGARGAAAASAAGADQGGGAAAGEEGRDAGARAEASTTRSRSAGRSCTTTSAAIGKRYRRQDEIGTPLCITIDGDTLKDGTVTVRERDSMQQARVSEDAIVRLVEDRLQG